MDKLIAALAPVFAAGLGIQQLGEILSPLVDKISPNYKKIILGLVSLALGQVLASQFDLHAVNVLLNTGSSIKHASLDEMVTGFIISGGTEGINSIVKFLKYKKEEVKTEAAARRQASAGGAPVTAPTAAALADINKK